jgi:hypothetical protein
MLNTSVKIVHNSQPLFQGSILFLQAQTKVLQQRDKGVVTNIVTFGPGMKLANTCKPYPPIPTQETGKQTPSRHTRASAASAAPFPSQLHPH